MSEHCLSKQEYLEYLQWPYFTEFLSLNYKPLNWVHDDWLQELEGYPTLKTLRSQKVQAWVRRSLNCQELDISCFKSKLSRLILLPSENLHQLLLAIGLSCYHSDVSRLIETRKKRMLEDLCSKNTVLYVEKNVPLLLKEQPFLIKQLTETHPFYDSEKKCFAEFSSLGAIIISLAVKHEMSLSQENEHLQSNIEHDNIWRQILELKTPRQTEVFLDEKTTIETLSTDKYELNSIKNLVLKLTRHLDPLCVNLYE